MKHKVEKMIAEVFPSAIPGKDFEVQVLPDQTAVITAWNSLKLGENPGLENIHQTYMRQVNRRKEIIPSYDATDPLPYLSEKPKIRRVKIETPPAEIFNGLAFTKIR